MYQYAQALRFLNFRHTYQQIMSAHVTKIQYTTLPSNPGQAKMHLYLQGSILGLTVGCNKQQVLFIVNTQLLTLIVGFGISVLSKYDDQILQAFLYIKSRQANKLTQCKTKLNPTNQRFRFSYKETRSSYNQIKEFIRFTSKCCACFMCATFLCYT